MSIDMDRQKRLRSDIDYILVPAQPSAQPFEVKPQIEAALKRHGALAGSHIAVAANGSAVTLSGFVKSWHERELAEQAALSVSGVTALTNRLRIHA